MLRRPTGPPEQNGSGAALPPVLPSGGAFAPSLGGSPHAVAMAVPRQQLATGAGGKPGAVSSIGVPPPAGPGLDVGLPAPNASLDPQQAQRLQLLQVLMSQQDLLTKVDAEIAELGRGDPQRLS
jgi:hypothetical protein